MCYVTLPALVGSNTEGNFFVNGNTNIRVHPKYSNNLLDIVHRNRPKEVSSIPHDLAIIKLPQDLSEEVAHGIVATITLPDSSSEGEVVSNSFKLHHNMQVYGWEKELKMDMGSGKELEQILQNRRLRTLNITGAS